MKLYMRIFKFAFIGSVNTNHAEVSLKQLLLISFFVALFSVSTGFAANGAAITTDNSEFQQWIEEMKTLPRGPFSRIRWFCNDGSVLPPKAYACRNRGGGIQHGQWNHKTQAMRDAGFTIANVIAAVDVDLISSDNSLLQQLLLERFLVTADNGWIFRLAQFYRGAFQAENEETAARNILLKLIADPEWLDRRLLLSFEAAAWLAHGAGSAELKSIRSAAVNIQNQDPGFAHLRNKIHGKPDAADAQRVRSYAKTKGIAAVADAYEALAVAIEASSDSTQIVARLDSISAQLSKTELRQYLLQVRQQLNASDEPVERIRIASLTAEKLRNTLTDTASLPDRLLLLDLLLVLQQSVFVDSHVLPQRQFKATRREQIGWITDLVRVLYATGALSPYEWQQFKLTLSKLSANQLDLQTYRRELNQLTRVPAWVHRRFALHFDNAVNHIAQIEPKVRDFIPDRLRSGPMLTYARLLQGLNADANRLAGIEHQFFNQRLSTGLRSLNPGLARGILMTEDDLKTAAAGDSTPILIVAETLADLPPVRGILTQHEGNYLSHVQLLARNLGIPNVVVDRKLLPELEQYRGKPVILASTPAGVVSLILDTGAPFAFAEQNIGGESSSRIVVDLEKLKLDDRSLVPIHGLRAIDSGVRVGPKAAQLGELTKRYPENVSAGVAIPFGVFRSLLDQPFSAGAKQSAFEWLKAQYQILDEIHNSDEKRRFRNQLLHTIRHWILTVELDDDLVDKIQRAMQSEFGVAGSYGVFVRSDTNVEDLPGFTGAGLNLTLPNVVGADATIDAIKRVWASPFSERAFGWRQALMDHPQHLYAAVLLHKSVNSQKSGVLVTANVETGNMEQVTIVTNEGVGGGVEGQSAETILVDKNSGEVRLLASATAPSKRVLLAQGDSVLTPSSTRARLLSEADIERLLALTADLHKWFRDGSNKALIADVEFGFVDDKLLLYQIRPFVENKTANQSQFLLELDKPLLESSQKIVDMDAAMEPPRG